MELNRKERLNYAAQTTNQCSKDHHSSSKPRPCTNRDGISIDFAFQRRLSGKFRACKKE